MIDDIADSLKKTKILATLGPATSTEEVITQLIESGANAVRLNFSHGTHEDHKKNIDLVRKIAKKLNTSIPIIQDLQGPKIRLGIIPIPYVLQKDQEVTLFHGTDQTDERIPVQTNIFSFLKKGDSVFINDGLIKLRVLEVSKKEATCIVITSGQISSHKGINLPDTHLPDIALTKKDLEDLEMGLREKVDYVAISFVQSADDVRKVKSIIKKHTHQPKVITKMETAAAIRHAEEIIHESNTLMIARGDLAVEVGQEEVPIIQRDLIRIARRHNTPTIIATQMLESMVQNAEPTRAEVNDVASAVLSEIDAVMLSAETAAGKFPVKAVQMMNRIIKRVEKYTQESQTNYSIPELEYEKDRTTAVGSAASLLAYQLQAKMIFVLTASGLTAQRLASYRPQAPIIAITNSEIVYHQLALVWGIKPFLAEDIKDPHNKTQKEIVIKLLDKKAINKDDTIVFISGTQPGKEGHTNTIHVTRAGEHLEHE